MRVVGINGSARKDGNTAIIIKIIFAELENRGIETELIQLHDKDIKSCKGCFSCKGNKKCILKDDIFNECLNKVLEADGIILGSPVYSADISSKMKAFIERTGVIVATNPELLKHKVGVSVVSARRGGGMTAVDTLNHFMLNKEMLLVGSTYWNMVYGKDVGDVLKDDEGIKNMKNLGQNMAWLLNKVHNT